MLIECLCEVETYEIRLRRCQKKIKRQKNGLFTLVIIMKVLFLDVWTCGCHYNDRMYDIIFITMKVFYRVLVRVFYMLCIAMSGGGVLALCGCVLLCVTVCGWVKLCRLSDRVRCCMRSLRGLREYCSRKRDMNWFPDYVTGSKWKIYFCAEQVHLELNCAAKSVK